MIEFHIASLRTTLLDMIDVLDHIDDEEPGENRQDMASALKRQYASARTDVGSIAHYSRTENPVNTLD